jgi:Tol biopolymer transport system component
VKRRVITAHFLALAAASCSGPDRHSPPAPEPGHTRLTALGQSAEDPCPAPGRTLFTRRSPGQVCQVWALPDSGPAIQSLIERPGDVRQPAMDGEGRLVAWTGNERGTWDIYTAGFNPDGSTGLPRLVEGSDEDESGPTWAPDSRRLAWAVFNRRLACWHLRVGDGMSEALDLGEGFAPSWHPSGDRLACQRARPGDDLWKVVILDIATGRATEIFQEPGHGAITPSWSRDGQWVYFAARVDTEEPGPAHFDGLWAVSADGAKRVRLTAAGIESFSPRETADGRIVYCRREGSAVEIWSFKSPLKSAESPK